jgi:hypothetical protein
MRMLPLTKIALFLGMAAALAGCMTPAAYAPRRPGEIAGYTDRELAPGRWRVTFTGNSVTPREMVEDYLLLRAAEVTLAEGGTHFIFDTRDTRANTRLYADTFGGYGGFGGGFGGGYWGGGGWGWGGYWGFRPRWGYDPFGPPVMISSTTRYEAYAEIVILKPGQETSERAAVDARAVVANVRMPPAPPPPG